MKDEHTIPDDGWTSHRGHGSHEFNVKSATGGVLAADTDGYIETRKGSFANDGHPITRRWDGSPRVLSPGEEFTFHSWSGSTEIAETHNQTEVYGFHFSTMTYDGSNFWVGGYDQNNNVYSYLYKYDTDFNLQSTLWWDHDTLTGLSHDGTYLWATAHDPDYLYKIDESGTIHGGFPTHTNSAEVVDWDGESGWCAASSANTIYEYDDKGNLKSKFQTPFRPAKAKSAGADLWISGYDVPYLYRFDKSGNHQETVYQPLDDSGDKEINPGTWDGSSFWTFRRNTTYIYRWDSYHEVEAGFVN